MLEQLPAVGIFAVFTLWIVRMAIGYMREERKAFFAALAAERAACLSALDRVTNELDRLADVVEELRKRIERKAV